MLIGLFQWLVIRVRVSQAFSWTWINMLGYATGFTVMGIKIYTPSDKLPPEIARVIFMALLELISASISAETIERFLRRSKRTR